jgi:Na+-driven multidrug efflux pump
MSFVAMLYNAQLMRYEPENGVAAYGVLMYVNMVFLSVFIGYSVGTAPIVGYHYGAQNYAELKSLRKKSLSIIGIASIVMFVAAELLAKPFALIFVAYDEMLFALTLRAFFIFSFSFLFCGFGILGSSFFTALNNGFASALISFLRTVVFQVGAVLLLPIFIGSDGIWGSVVVGELLALFVTMLLLICYRKKYKY